MSPGSLIALAATFGVTLICVLLLRRAAPALGLLDLPDDRKRHDGAIPAIGGVAMFAAMAVIGLLLEPPSRGKLGFGLAAFFVVAVGVLDDRHRLRWRVRMAAQTAAALILIHVSGWRVEDLGTVAGEPFHHLGWLSDPLSVIAVVGVINAVNWFDGMDGLAGAVSLASLSLMAIRAVAIGNVGLASDLFVVIGAVAAFLVFNLRGPWRARASVFMGNAGAELLGLTIAAAAFRLTQDPAYVVAPKFAPFVLAPPLIDCLVLAGKRMLKRQSPFHADRDHIQYLMLDAGFTPVGVTIILASATLALGALAWIGVDVGFPGWAFTLTFIGLCLAYFLATRTRERGVSVLRQLRALVVPRSA